MEPGPAEPIQSTTPRYPISSHTQSSTPPSQCTHATSSHPARILAHNPSTPPETPPITSPTLCTPCAAGVMSCLNRHFRMSAVPSVGSSAGGLVAILGACDVPPREAVRAAFRLAREAGVYERRLGLLGIWRGLVQR